MPPLTPPILAAGRPHFAHLMVFFAVALCASSCKDCKNRGSSSSQGPFIEEFERQGLPELELVPGKGREGKLDSIRMPPGFEIAYFARDLEGARSLEVSPAGTVFVGSRAAGNVYALTDDDGDGVADGRHTIASGLNSPNGVAWRDGDLFVAEIGRILRFDDIEERLDDPPEPAVVTDRYPGDAHHGWKFISFGPDGRLYVPVGAPCNVCNPDDEIYSTITRIDPDGSNFEIYARGVRNTVGFDWHPETDTLWFTDNGRDMLGDNRPPDELNRAPKSGMHFGFPFCHGGDIRDPEFDDRSCSKFVPPAQKLGPHVAALGADFYTGDMFPEAYRNHLLIAEHGSWNRSTPIGYRITMVPIDPQSEQKGRALGYDVFAEGWLQSAKVKWGRPVDLEELADGSLLVSDDAGDAVYRITYRAP